MTNHWWQESIVYQIYPKSFQDTANNGIGDLQGITQQLDYIQSLGVNTLWLNPIFISPQVDNGYDISNYYAIDPLFGRDQDFTELINEAHHRGMKVLLDLVLNHTSNQHPWFLEASKSRDNIYRDYYLWEKPGEKGELPNNWGSFFGGSVWEKDTNSDEYYFHLFDKKMPDLNWENVEVRNAMLDIAKYWVNKGVDGFRLDAFIHMAKADFSQQVPGVPVGEVALAEEYYANLPKVQTYLGEFLGQLRELKADLFFLGEAASATEELAVAYTDLVNQQCETVVSFKYFPEKQVAEDPRLPERLQPVALDVKAFKEGMVSWQSHLSEERYPTLYWNNHDMPRLVSRFGDDQVYRTESSQMLATLMYLQRGIPIILYGEEIGMKNLTINDVASFHDPAAKADYQNMLAQGVTASEALAKLASINKEASRGVMQWNDQAYSGFSKTKPWSGVNQESRYNVAEQTADPKSVLNYYKKLLKLKKEPLFSQGTFDLLPSSDETYVYRRQLDEEVALVITNLTKSSQVVELPVVLSDYDRLLSNYQGELPLESTIKLPAYGSLVITKA